MHCEVSTHMLTMINIHMTQLRTKEGISLFPQEILYHLSILVPHIIVKLQSICVLHTNDDKKERML